MPQRTIKPAFEFGDIVFLKSDQFKTQPYVVIGYVVGPGGLKYEIRFDINDPIVRFFCELTDDSTPAADKPETTEDEDENE